MEPLKDHEFKRLKVGVIGTVGCMELHRPEKSNAFDDEMWAEFPRVRALPKYAPMHEDPGALLTSMRTCRPSRRWTHPHPPRAREW